MHDVSSPIAESFSIMRGGPFYRLLTQLGLTGSERHQVIRRAPIGTSLCWFPLLILAAAQGLAAGTKVRIPFLLDYAVQARFLVALPILILAESVIEGKWRNIVIEFLRSGLVDRSDAVLYESILRSIMKLRDQVLPELVMVVLAYLPPLFLGKTELLAKGTTSWHILSQTSSELSLAGWWFRLVSAPVFRFLLLRWIWRMCLWTLFIWRVSRMKLYLVATHADLAAGLGFLSEGQEAYSSIVFAGGAVIAGSVLNAIRYQGETLSSLKTPMIAYGVLALILLVVPLLVVTPVLFGVKKKALCEYSRLVTEHDQLFETKWIRDYPSQRANILGNSDSSSLVALGSSYTIIRKMGIVPIDKASLKTLALAAALPMLPVILLVTPVDEVIHAVLKMLG